MFKLKRYSTRKWTHIIIHHSATVDGQTYDWEALDKYHVTVKMWSEIGYHFGVEIVNGLYKLCIGRGLSKVGGHTLGMNEIAIGICLVGNYDLVEPDDTQYMMLAGLCKNLMIEFDIPLYNIETHNKYNTEKSCPGKLFSMQRLYDEISKITGGINEKNVNFGNSGSV